jgi:hypothetical protein
MTPQQFVEKWLRVDLPERSASQQHFIDLCHMLGQPTPADHDATGAEYAFEKMVDVTEGASLGAKGDRGFADVWWRGKFGWEYKRKGKYDDLQDAYRQLLQYREALGSPPLLIVSDIARTEIHTNFTGTTKQVHTIALADFADPAALDKVRRIFTDPESFKPQLTVEKVTEEVAGAIGRLAIALQKKGYAPLDVAHFLMKCVFCLFAEDVELLPKKLFTKLLERAHREPAKFQALASNLFEQMRTGGEFGVDPIPWFNGGLFNDAAAVDLNFDHICMLQIAANRDWSSVEPHIFGTLFERALDPEKRAQIGAHYTSREDIMLVVEPVVLAPLRREWDAVRAKVAEHLVRRAAAVKDAGIAAPRLENKAAITRANKEIHNLIGEFQSRLAKVRILDPACGSGNFLYIALQQLLNLEKELVAFGALPHIAMPLIPRVRPTQLHGIELNTYAAELASVVIWIGYLQWMRDNGFLAPNNPVLEKMESIENRDAILDLSTPELPVPAKWPTADFIIGNPPFLGSKLFRKSGLSEEYLAALYGAYDLPKTSDLCCYWFEKARRLIEELDTTRAGLLATQGIRGGDNRTVLERIKAFGDLFMAWDDKEWILDGAAVHVAIVGFDDGTETTRQLDGCAVNSINADLTSGANVTAALRLTENAKLAFQGQVKVGSFEMPSERARTVIADPNPRPDTTNAQVIRPWMNASHLTRRNLGMWIIDFQEMPMAEASLFERPFEYVVEHIKAEREKNNDKQRRTFWWRLGRSGSDFREAKRGLRRVLVTPRVAKHRVFAWADLDLVPDCQLVAVARDDDWTLGVLQSSIHEVWARQSGTQLREEESGFRYTPSSTFETFSLPWPPGKEDVKHPAYVRISEAAKALNEQRERWLNPPEWIEPLAAKVDAADKFADVPAEARALVRQSAIMAAAAKDARLKKRTLTNLYNERPTWLRLAHQQLDRAVLAAYAATDTTGGWDEDWAEVWTETGAGQPLPADHALAARRAEIDQKVLANLLRLNHARAKGDTRPEPAPAKAKPVRRRPDRTAGPSTAGASSE